MSIQDEIIQRRRRAFEREGWLVLFGRIALIALIAYLVFTQAFLLTQNHGQNMFPALKDGDLCIVYRTGLMALTGEKLKSGDIVAYTRDGQRLIGRVAAAAGDIVMITQDGDLSVNGVRQTGEIVFPTYPRDGASYPLKVPEGELFVLGDYRTQAKDSRDTGTVPVKSVEGKVISILRRRGL